MDYDHYEFLRFERRPPGILVITIDRPAAMNATNARLHLELSRVWRDIGDDDETRIALVTGAGDHFSVGGDFELLDETMGDAERVARVWREAGDLVYNMINLDKPIISAINGVAVGAGLAVALMADISIASETARITDGHLRIGVAAGDHAAIIWPLLCGMAKAKYYLLTADFLDGREAERIGLVSMCVPAADLMDRAMAIADRLAKGPQHALQWTKRALNNWLRSAGPAFDASLALEMMGFFGPDMREGVAAVKARRAPSFPTAAPIGKR